MRKSLDGNSSMSIFLQAEYSSPNKQCFELVSTLIDNTVKQQQVDGSKASISLRSEEILAIKRTWRLSSYK